MTYTTGQIAELFPDLMQIRDGALRDKVAAVWSDALASGCGGRGWTFAEIRAMPFTLLAGKINLAFVEHLNSCVKQCLAIADTLTEDAHTSLRMQRMGWNSAYINIPQAAGLAAETLSAHVNQRLAAGRVSMWTSRWSD